MEHIWSNKTTADQISMTFIMHVHAHILTPDDLHYFPLASPWGQIFPLVSSVDDIFPFWTHFELFSSTTLCAKVTHLYSTEHILDFNEPPMAIPLVQLSHFTFLDPLLVRLT